MADSFHYPPELFSLLIDTIPLLCRGKKDVLVFFQGAGVPEADMAPMTAQLYADAKSVSKYQIARHVLEAINARGDSSLAARREVIKRIVEFEEFSTCWPADQLKAKGLVADVRKVVNVKDSFTRMKQERDVERQQTVQRKREEKAEVATKQAQVHSVRDRLFSLFGMDDKPNARGKLLESVLNDLFRAYGVLVREDFRRRDFDGPSSLSGFAFNSLTNRTCRADLLVFKKTFSVLHQITLQMLNECHFNIDHKVKSTGFSRSALALLIQREWNNSITISLAGVARLAGAGR